MNPTQSRLSDLLTVVIPSLNEGANLRRCLESLNRFPNVIIVDSGSTDSTLDIARDCGFRVVHFDWNGSFPKKRNWVLRQGLVETPWILFLDADESLSKPFWNELGEILPSTDKVGFWLTYENYFRGKLLRWGLPMRKLALLRQGAGEYERIDEKSWSHLDMEVHEQIVVDGATGTISGPIIHRDFRGLHHYIAKHNEYSTWEARRFLDLKERLEETWSRLTLRQKVKYRLFGSTWMPFVYFVYSYCLRGGFLDGVQGMHFHLFKMFYFYSVSCKLSDLKRESISNCGKGKIESERS